MSLNLLKTNQSENQTCKTVTKISKINTVKTDPAMVAWFAKASVSHLVDSDLSANGGSNPVWGRNYMVP